MCILGRGSMGLEARAEESTPPLEFVCGQGDPLPTPTFSIVLPSTQI